MLKNFLFGINSNITIQNMLIWVAQGIARFTQIFYLPTLLDKYNQVFPLPSPPTLFHVRDTEVVRELFYIKYIKYISTELKWFTFMTLWKCKGLIQNIGINEFG